MTSRKIAVIDIGKTNAKVAVVDLDSLEEIAVRTRPNTVLEGPLYPHFDIDALWAFVTAAIAEMNRIHPIEAITITTHGACCVLVADDGGLAMPVLDYEHSGPDSLKTAYAAIRPPFSRSFSPHLPGGLNIGAQLHWLEEAFPDAFARARWILTYAQYWAYRLTGVAASELTSIGCHTDLWDFERADFSALVDARGWREKFPPLRGASDVLGPLTDDLARDMGFAAPVPVYCGIHDSNASLLPHVLSRTPPFSVVSTGTWVIVASPGGRLDVLDERRDCLANIDALGRSVPSARFMGGREFSLLTDGENRAPGAETVRKVLEERIMLRPSVQQGYGPFPHRAATWSHPKEAMDADTLFTVVSFYLALMTAECIALTGGDGDVVVEGPFARNALYLAMLAAATGRPVHASTRSSTGTSIGAAMLARMDRPPALPDKISDATFDGLPQLTFQLYGKDWRAGLGAPSD